MNEKDQVLDLEKRVTTVEVTQNTMLRMLEHQLSEHTKYLKDIDDKLTKDYTELAVLREKLDQSKKQIDAVARIARAAEEKADRNRNKIYWMCGIAFGASFVIQYVIQFAKG